MTRRFRVGTRRSRLARIQTGLALRRLERAHPSHRFEPVELETSGDRDRAVGGSTDFTDAIDRAVVSGEIDVGVHSAKDLPVSIEAALTLVGCLARGDHRDSLVLGPTAPRGTLPRGARVGSSSPRRRAQLLRWRRDLTVVEMRGNVDTRLDRVRSGEVDAAILAIAGLTRLGRSNDIDRRLPAASFLPSPGQGAIALVARSDDRGAADRLRSVCDPATTAAVAAERSFAERIGGGCSVPLGAYASVHRGLLRLTGEVLRPDGTYSLLSRCSGPTREAVALGATLADRLLKLGAATLLTTPTR